MISINRKKSKKSLYILTSLLAVTVLLGFGLFFVFHSDSKRDTSNTKRAEEVKKSQQTVNSSDSKKSGLPGGTPRTSEEVPANTSLSLDNVTVSQSNGLVTATASTSGNGTCVFQYTNEFDKPVIEQTSVKDNSCTSEISEINFTRLGVWNLKISYYNNETKTELEQNVTIR